MAADISIRNWFCQPEKFPVEMQYELPGVVGFGMGSRRDKAKRRNHLASWLEFFDVGPGEVAKAIKVNPSYVSNIARNAKNPSADVMLDLSEYFGITVNDLYEQAPPKAAVTSLSRYHPQTRDAILKRLRG